MAEKVQGKILRIGIVHEGRIIEERLLKKRGDVTVGSSPKCTFILPIANLPESYRLFLYERGRYSLRFTAGMTGKISVGDRLAQLSELKDSNLVRRSGNYFLLPLDESSRGRLLFGEVSLLFQFVVPPPPIPKLELPAAAKGGILSRIDTPLFLALMVSLILQAGGVGGVQYWWKTVGQFQVKKAKPYADAYELLKAEVERRMPPEQPKAQAAGAGEGEGTAEEAGTEEVAETKATQRPQRSAGNAESAEEQYRKKLAKVRNTTILRHLGAYGSGPDAIQGAGVEHGSAAARLTSAWDTRGVEVAGAGAPPSGFRAGPPGGGSGQGTTYEKLGRDEMGPTRPAAQVAGGAREEEIKVRIREGTLGDQTGIGRIDKAAVESVFRRRMSAIRVCYERSLKVNPDVQGKVTIRFTIGRAGTITDIQVTENTTGDPSIGTCIAQKVRTWRFSPPDEGEVTFSYPFLLQKG